MLAANFDIISKRRADPVGLVDIKDFEIHECGQIDAREILMNERISLYAFDFEKGQAMFVETTALSMLEYCGYSPEDVASIEETLSKDSQQGSAVSQDFVKQRRMAELFDPEEMNRFLKSHPYIQTANFEVPNSLKL